MTIFLKTFFMTFSIVFGVLFLSASIKHIQRGRPEDALLTIALFLLAGLLWVKMKQVKK